MVFGFFAKDFFLALAEMIRSRERNDGRKCVDGVKVYSEEELKLNSNGGDTEDCPFDCNCCF